MKAVFARSPFKFDIRELEIPRPSAGEVLVKVHACGLCGTDMHFAQDWTQDFMPLGHEIAAEVVELGKGAAKCKVGDKVIVEDVGLCGVCEHCKNGESYRCRNNYNLNGQPGMAEYMAVSEHLLNHFEGMDYVSASLTEPLAVALNTVLHAEIPLAGNVVVWGPGPIGLLCVRVSRLQGAGKGTLVGYSPNSAREVARMNVGADLGADHLLYAAADDPVERLRSIFPNGADRVIVTSPPKTLSAAIKMAAFGGIVSFIGINLGGQSAVELDVNDLIFNKVTLRPTFAEPGIKFPVSIRLLKEGIVDASKLISHTFGFDDTERTFRMNADGDEKVIKAVLVP